MQELSLFAVEADEQGNEITADEEYQQKMTDLMIKKAEEAEAVSRKLGKVGKYSGKYGLLK